MEKRLQICSPLNGKAVPLDSVPDQVFSERVLGDGCAVIPTDGKIYSPCAFRTRNRCTQRRGLHAACCGR